jgi:general secretion pathway protein H
MAPAGAKAATVTSPAGRARGGTAGYLLIELVAALALAGLLAILAFPGVPGGTTPVRFRALLTDVASLLRDVRSTAIAQGSAAAASFDRRSRMLRAGVREVRLPADVDLSLTAGGRCPASPDTIDIVFRADGTSCGGILRLARGGHAFSIRVNWATGHVEIVGS